MTKINICHTGYDYNAGMLIGTNLVICLNGYSARMLIDKNLINRLTGYNAGMLTDTI